MNVKSTWTSTWHRLEHVSWSLGLFSRNHLLEVGLAQNWETMAFQMLITVELFYFIMCEDPHEWKFIEIAFGWGPGHIWFHTTLEDPWPYYMILEVSWHDLRTLSFGLSQLHGHGSWLVCGVTLRATPKRHKKKTCAQKDWTTSSKYAHHCRLKSQHGGGGPIWPLNVHENLCFACI